jgi:hypothetical protein
MGLKMANRHKLYSKLHRRLPEENVRGAKEHTRFSSRRMPEGEWPFEDLDTL